MRKLLTTGLADTGCPCLVPVQSDRNGKTPLRGGSVRRVLQIGCQVAALCRFELFLFPSGRALLVSPKNAPRSRSPAPRLVRRWRRSLPRPHRPRVAVTVVRTAAMESSASAFTRSPRRRTAVAWEGRPAVFFSTRTEGGRYVYSRGMFLTFPRRFGRQDDRVGQYGDGGQRMNVQYEVPHSRRRDEHHVGPHEG